MTIAPPALGVRAVLRRAAGVLGFSVVVALLDGAAAVVASRDLGPSGRGVYAVVVTLAAGSAALASFGVPTTGRVRLSRADGSITLGGYLAMAIRHVAAGTLVAGLVSLLFAVSLLDVGGWNLAVIGGALGGGMVLSSFGFEAMHGLGRQSLATACNAFGSAMALVISLLLAIGIDDAPPSAYLLGLGGSIASQGLLAVGLARRIERSPLAYERFRHRRMLRDALPAMPFQLSTLATYRLDRYLVGLFAGVESAGVYSVASTLSEATRQLPISLGQVLLFGRSSGRVDRATEQRARRLVLGLAWAALVLIGVLAPWIVEVLFGSAFRSAVGPMRILLLAEVVLAMWSIDAGLLIGSSRFAAASKSTIVSGIVVVVANSVLIPPFGLPGAAFASVIAYTAAWLSIRPAVRDSHAAVSGSLPPSGR
jgi:O-antigen/teichoic acid export membrane protein